MQTGSAFSSVQGALSFFITIYRQLAEWQAVVNRLDGFEAGIADATQLANRDDRIHLVQAAGDGAIDFKGLAVRLPNGRPLVNADGFSLRKDERTLVTGPSGSGKSTLFRAIAGIWPFGTGSIAIPANATMMMLPQRPYFPVGSLHQAIEYPGKEGTFTAAQMSQALEAVGLTRLASQLDEHGHWNRTLSLGEQQRLGLARALLHAPQYLFLDEATASLDEPSEAALYGLLRDKLPATTLVSIGHRSTLDAFHQRNVVFARDGDGFTLQERSETAKPS
jgi:putative ATP-binding cassette transporter